MRKYLIIGILTIIPVWITWLVVRFLVILVIDIGELPALWLATMVQPAIPGAADIILHPVIQKVTAIAIVLILLYFIGWLSSIVFGKRIIERFDRLVERIPFIKIIYGGSKKLLESFQKRPDEVKSVVLINYPSPEMKAIGLLTKYLTDEQTGEKLAAVYVPTTPNPTSGFIEIIPADDLIYTDWEVNEAISFIVSGGVVGPEEIAFTGSSGVDNSAQ